MAVNCTCLPGRATAVTAGAWETDDKRRRRKRPTSAASMASVSSVWQSPTMRSSSRSPSAVRHAYTFQRLANFQYLIYMPIFIFFFFFLSVTTLEMNGEYCGHSSASAEYAMKERKKSLVKHKSTEYPTIACPQKKQSLPLSSITSSNRD